MWSAIATLLVGALAVTGCGDDQRPAASLPPVATTAASTE
jgi:hypothetical protein